MNAAVREVSPPQTPSTETPSRPRRVHSPRVDVLENEREFVIAADVPGSDMDSIELTVEEGRLDLVARRSEKSYEGYKVAFRQYGEGDYRRAFTLPDGVDRSAIRADLRDGVLRIRLPKKEVEQARRVEIKVG